MNGFIKKYKSKNIISYVDRRYSIGNLYHILNFSFQYYTGSNSFYILNNQRFNYKKLKFNYKIYDSGYIKILIY